MAQFDVFRNPGRNRTAIPFVVSLQNSRYDRRPTRLVAALAAASVNGAVWIEEHWLAPTFDVEGQTMVLDVFNIVAVPATKLGSAIASLSDETSRQKLIRAIDELFSQA